MILYRPRMVEAPQSLRLCPRARPSPKKENCTAKMAQLGNYIDGCWKIYQQFPWNNRNRNNRIPCSDLADILSLHDDHRSAPPHYSVIGHPTKGVLDTANAFLFHRFLFCNALYSFWAAAAQNEYNTAQVSHCVVLLGCQRGCSWTRTSQIVFGQLIFDMHLHEFWLRPGRSHKMITTVDPKGNKRRHQDFDQGGHFCGRASRISRGKAPGGGRIFENLQKIS